MKKVLSFIFLLSSLNCFSQTSWKMQYTSLADSGHCTKVVPCADGGYFALFDVNGECAAIVIKTDSNGSVEWSKKYHASNCYMGPSGRHDLISTPDSGFYLSVGGTIDDFFDAFANHDNYELSKKDKYGNGNTCRWGGGTYTTDFQISLQDVDKNTSSVLAIETVDNDSFFVCHYTRLILVDAQMNVQLSVPLLYSGKAKIIYFGGLQDGYMLLSSAGNNGKLIKMDILGNIEWTKVYSSSIGDFLQVDSSFYLLAYPNKIIKTDYYGNPIFCKRLNFTTTSFGAIALSDSGHLMLSGGWPEPIISEIDTAGNYLRGIISYGNQYSSFSCFDTTRKCVLFLNSTSSSYHNFKIQKEYLGNPSCNFMPLNGYSTADSIHSSLVIDTIINSCTLDNNSISLNPDTVTFTASRLCSSTCNASVQIQNTCSTSCIGSITVAPANGVAPFSFAWSTGDTSTTIDSLCSGYYSFTISDSTGCTSLYNVNVPINPFSVSANWTSPICYNGCDGSAIVFVQDGTPPYTYLWNTGDTTAFLTNRCAEHDTVIVLDSNQCSATAIVWLNNPSIALSSSAVHYPTCVACTDGYIIVHIAGGTSPYVITWSPTNGTLAGDTIFNLPAGTYSITVTDLNGCDTSYNETLVDAPDVVPSVSSQNLFQIFYNPTTGELIVRDLPIASGEIEIFNSIGEKIFSFPVTSEYSKFQLGNCLPGVYLIKASDGKKEYSKKLLIVTNAR